MSVTTGYERVRVEIVRQAINDYEKALKRESKGKPPLAIYSVKSLEKFFLSEWGQALSGNNGKYIIEKCRRRVEIKKSRGKDNGRKTNVCKDNN